MLSASQHHESGTPCLSAFAKPSHFLLSNAILRLTFSRQLTPPPSNPPSNALWFFNRLRRYISFVLTYFLTYLLKVHVSPCRKRSHYKKIPTGFIKFGRPKKCAQCVQCAQCGPPINSNNRANNWAGSKACRTVRAPWSANIVSLTAPSMCSTSAAASASNV